MDYVNEIIEKNNQLNFNEILSEKKLLKAVNSLTPRQREIIYKCIIDDIKESEVAKQLGISVQAVNKIKNKALTKIKAIY